MYYILTWTLDRIIVKKSKLLKSIPTLNLGMSVQILGILQSFLRSTLEV